MLPLDCGQIGHISDKRFNFKKKLENGDSLSSHRVGKCGRKPVSSPRQDRMLVAMYKNKRSSHTVTYHLRMSG